MIDYSGEPVARLALSTRARNVLFHEKIETVGQLAELRYVDLMRMPNMGRTSIEEIEAELGRIGLRLVDRIGPRLPSLPSAELSCIELPEQPTLRDRFAMAALTGLIIGDKVHGPVSIVDDAYRVADAMMAARK